MTTPGRRPLRFESFDDVMPDVERLLLGHSTVGAWSLAQTCRHLAIVIRRVVDLPASAPHDPSKWLGDDRKREVFETGLLPEGLPGIAEVLPSETFGERDEADGLREAIKHYLASPTGPVAPHRLFGPLSKAEWDQIQRIHLAHHLSFAKPMG